jgi:hypothetical protein
VVRHVSLLNGPVYFIFRRGDDAGHVDLRHTEDQEKHGLGRRQLRAGSLTQQQTLQHANEAQHQYFYAQRHTHTGRRSGPGLALRSHCMDLRDGRRSKLHTARLILCFKSTIASLVAPAIHRLFLPAACTFQRRHRVI